MAQLSFSMDRAAAVRGNNPTLKVNIQGHKGKIAGVRCISSDPRRIMAALLQSNGGKVNGPKLAVDGSNSGSDTQQVNEYTGAELAAFVGMDARVIATPVSLSREHATILTDAESVNPADLDWSGVAEVAEQTPTPAPVNPAAPTPTPTLSVSLADFGIAEQPAAPAPVQQQAPSTDASPAPVNRIKGKSRKADASPAPSTDASPAPVPSTNGAATH